MSISVQLFDVAAILIAGQWWSVVNKSFQVDAGGFETHEGQVAGEALWFTATAYESAGEFVQPARLSGPVSSIQAIRVSEG